MLGTTCSLTIPNHGWGPSCDLCWQCTQQQVPSQVVFRVGALVLFFLLCVEVTKKNPKPPAQQWWESATESRELPTSSDPLPSRETRQCHETGKLRARYTLETEPKPAQPLAVESSGTDALHTALSFLWNSFSHNPAGKPGHKLCLRAPAA